MVVFKLSYLILLIVLFRGFGVDGGFEFTNIICTSLDKEYMDVEACYLKSINRTFKYLTFRTKIHQLPLTDFSIRVETLKRLNGYKPFLFNFTTDACQFLKGKRNPLLKFWFGTFAAFSNLNHTCPYTHDIIVEKLPISFLNHHLTVVLPFPEGNYMGHSVYTTRGKERLDLKVFVRIY